MEQKRGSRISLGIFLGAVFTALVITTTMGLAAEKFPSQPITIVVPWGAGGTTDTVARMIAPNYGKILGQPVVVVNKPGASGYIGVKSVSTARPDGYTLGSAGLAIVSLAVTDPKLSIEEFKWIGQSYAAMYVIAVNAESPWKTIEEFIDYAKKNPKSLKCGKSDTYGTTHIFSEGFARAAGIQFTQVDYKAGMAATALAVASKEVDLTVQSMLSLRSFLDADKIRILATLADKRSPNFQNLPTVKEKGIDWIGITYEGLIVAKDTPDDVVAILDKSLEKALADPALSESFKKFDIYVDYKDHKSFTAFTKMQDKQVRETLKVIGYKPTEK